MDLKENIHNLTIGQAKLVAVTKGIPAELVLESLRYGITDIGESSIKEAEEKYRYIGRNAKWHFIGNLNRKDIPLAIRLFDIIQSLDSFRLAKRINREAERQEKIMKVMIRVNISGNGRGVEPENVIAFYNNLTGLRHLEIIGLMCESSDENPQIGFKKMKNLNCRLKLPFLSMGTSDDYSIALEEGSNMVRLGQKIFGKKMNLFEEALNDVINIFKRIFA